MVEIEAAPVPASSDTALLHGMSDDHAIVPSEESCLRVLEPNNGTVVQLRDFLAGMRSTAQLIQDLHGFSQFTLELVLRELGSKRGSLMVLDNQRILRIQAARGLPQRVIEQTAIPIGVGVAGRVASLGLPVLGETNRAASDLLGGNGRYRSDSYLSVPLPGDQRVLGVVNVTEPIREEPFRYCDLEHLVNIADSLGQALHRAIQYREAEELAVRDDLTGLYNRRYFMGFLDTLLKRARTDNFTVTLLSFDIDHFKQYNDRYGHPVGDIILREVAKLMRENFRAHDVVCRLGGEEFAVILWDGRTPISQGGGPNYPSTAFEFAERLRQAMMHHRFDVIRRDGITLSGGLATFPWNGSTPSDLMNQADDALYRAKRDGRNRVYLCGQYHAS